MLPSIDNLVPSIDNLVPCGVPLPGERNLLCLLSGQFAQTVASPFLQWRSFTFGTTRYIIRSRLGCTAIGARARD